MSDKTKVLLLRALLGFVLVETPILADQLQRPIPNWWTLLFGIVGAAAGYFEKNYAPQLLSVLADAGQAGPVLPVTSAPLKDVQVTPPAVVTSASSTGSEAEKAAPPLEPAEAPPPRVIAPPTPPT